MDDEWALGNQMFMTNEPNARPITVSYVSGGQTFLRTDEQGFLDNGGFNITQHGHAFNSAVYLSDSWRVNKWLLDASVRYEKQDATNHVCNRTDTDLDGNPLTIYNNVVGVCNGTFATTDYDEDFTSWTVGANYSFTDFMSAYVRVNRGGHFLDFDNGIRGSTTGNTPPMQLIRNYEGGFKFENELFYADISATFATSPACFINQPMMPAQRSAIGYRMAPSRRESISSARSPPATTSLPGGCQLSGR
jgi:outer membrane receptor protein involved in Fe transport